ncbi:hypothetical protein M0R45_025484 [Rubus argutus]|uniref:Uncharacterized protein n=1 Tax=Rubus argutus TaxID=59490 RepID=A0AAW1WWK9_RUBAR
MKKGTEKGGALSTDEKAGAVGAIAGLAALEIAKLVSGSTSTSESFRSRSAKKKGSFQSSTNYQVKGTENDGDLSMDQKAAVTAGAIAGLSAWGVVKLVSGSSISTSTSGGQKKTMKAPGRNEWIDRDDFERDPAAYFKSLRN